MKRKQGRFLIGGVAALVVLAGVEITLSQMNRRAAEKETEETEGVNPINLDTDSLTEVTVKNQYGTFSLKKEDGVWVDAEDGDFPLDEDTWTGKLSGLENLTVVRTLEEPEDLAEYGLAQPSMELTIRDGDGGESHICIGGQNAGTGDYYIYVDSPETVYTVSSSLASSMDCKLYDLAESEAFPEIPADTLYGIAVDNGAQSLELTYKKTVDGTGTASEGWMISRDGGGEQKADSSALAALTDALSYIAYEEFIDYKGEDLEQYGLDEPSAEITWDYTETETVDAAVAAESDTEAETVDAAAAAESDTGVKTDTETESETESETETETITVEKQIILQIGDPVYADTEAESETQEEDTEAESETQTQTAEESSAAKSRTETEADREVAAYYVKLSDSSQVYTMSADTLSEWLDMSYTDYVDKYISQVPQTAMESLTVIYNGKDYILTVETETQTIEEKQEEEQAAQSESETGVLGAETAETAETVYIYRVNGKKADETNFLSFYGEVTSMQAQTITENAQVSGEPDLALEFRKTDGTEVTADYYLGNDGMYTVICSNGLSGKVSKLKVAELLESFETLIS